MKRIPPPRRPRRANPPAQHELPGLGADSLEGMSPAQIAARFGAAQKRADAALRASVAHGLAKKVAAVPKPKPAKPRVVRAPSMALPPENYSPSDTALLVGYADDYDAGVPLPESMTPGVAAWVLAEGKRLRTAQRPAHYADRQTS